MTNKELINHLLDYPMDAKVVVVYRACSDYSILTADEIDFHTKEIKPAYEHSKRYILHNGTPIEFDEKQWDYAKDGQPEFLDIIAFPGN